MRVVQWLAARIHLEASPELSNFLQDLLVDKATINLDQLATQRDTVTLPYDKLSIAVLVTHNSILLEVRVGPPIVILVMILVKANTAVLVMPNKAAQTK